MSADELSSFQPLQSLITPLWAKARLIPFVQLHICICMGEILASTTRRQLLTAIGMMGGTAALYQAMTTMGHAAETQFAGPPNLSGARAGASVLVLGAGLGGMLAAYEL